MGRLPAALNLFVADTGLVFSIDEQHGDFARLRFDGQIDLAQVISAIDPSGDAHFVVALLQLQSLMLNSQSDGLAVSHLVILACNMQAFRLLEDNKETAGILDYSVSQV